ncbi:hypothetical protein FHW23_001156 [Curtobacterium pusillum]|uniref:Uncharacterized protein n=1 Tax=Curtobacterium pusillum TaxID=69373 RepID=A0AAW3T5H6_9MICO|nr:hypothetical protein [Curtobacterium pusillum]MBA8989910.1 hypothetical protein [Curtobacterium pusillum]
MLALVFLLLPVAVMLVVGVAANGFDRAAVIVLLAFGTASVAVGVCIMRTAAFVTCTHEHVVVGFAPFWRTRLRQEDIAEAALVSVDAFAEYGGWGVKGRPHEDRGRLYSAGGNHAVRLRTWDGRTYVVAFNEAAEARGALSAVERLTGSRGSGCREQRTGRPERCRSSELNSSEGPRPSPSTRCQSRTPARAQCASGCRASP